MMGRSGNILEQRFGVCYQIPFREFGGRSRSSSSEEEVGGWWVLLIEFFWPNADLDENYLHKV